MMNKILILSFNYQAALCMVCIVQSKPQWQPNWQPGFPVPALQPGQGGISQNTYSYLNEKNQWVTVFETILPNGEKRTREEISDGYSGNSGSSSNQQPAAQNQIERGSSKKDGQYVQDNRGSYKKDDRGQYRH